MIRSIGLAAAAISLLTACASSSAVRHTDDRPSVVAREPGPEAFADLTKIAGDFVWQQAIEAGYPGGSGSFAAVLEKIGGKITVVGLTPFGTRAFSIRQENGKIYAEKYIDREMPFPPSFVLLDIHRTFFLGIDPRPTQDGWHEQRLGDGRGGITGAGALVAEQWQNGRLFERVYREQSREVVTIRYEGGFEPGAPPPTVTLENHAFHYVLKIRTLSQKNLDRPVGN